MGIVTTGPIPAAVTATAGGHPLKIARDEAIIRERAKGASYPKIAAALHVGVQTAHDVVKRHQDRLAVVQREIQEKVCGKLGAAADNMALVASDFDHRNNVNAAKWLAEIVLGWGPKGVHIGDNITNNTQVNVSLAGLDLTHDASAETSARRLLGLGD